MWLFCRFHEKVDETEYGLYGLAHDERTLRGKQVGAILLGDLHDDGCEYLDEDKAETSYDFDVQWVLGGLGSGGLFIVSRGFGGPVDVHGNESLRRGKGDRWDGGHHGDSVCPILFNEGVRIRVLERVGIFSTEGGFKYFSPITCLWVTVCGRTVNLRVEEGVNR